MLGGSCCVVWGSAVVDFRGVHPTQLLCLEGPLVLRLRRLLGIGALELLPTIDHLGKLWHRGRGVRLWLLVQVGVLVAHAATMKLIAAMMVLVAISATTLASTPCLLEVLGEHHKIVALGHVIAQTEVFA